VLVRLSHSHIRIGTFQRLAFEQDAVRIARLVDHVLVHYMPNVDRSGDDSAKAAALLENTAARVARTGAQWMAAGFVHGVLNTDNINITGESFDYGPYRFLPHYDPAFTAAYFDQGGLYAYGRQPGTLLWNLQRLAECLRLVAEEQPLVAALQTFAPAFERALAAAMLARLNLAAIGDEQDLDLIGHIFLFLHDSRMPFEQFFFDWYGGLASRDRADRSPEAHHYRAEAFAPVQAALEPYRPVDPSRLQARYFQQTRPQALIIDEIEQIWAAIAERDDWQPLADKLTAIEDAGRAYGFWA
jgi:uncharacterized protein YdiU (UPF0061 family)